MCVYRIYDHLLPTHVALVRFVAKQTGALALPLFVEGALFHFTPAKGWNRDALAVDAQTRADIKVSVALLGWWTGVVSVR